jgi:hypothetical protein
VSIERSIGTRLNEESLSIDRAARSSLARYFGHSKAGYPLDVRTPLYGKAPREEIIERFKAGIGFTQYPELTAIDEKEISKIGPYSIMLPWSERRGSVDEFRHQSYQGDNTTLEHVVGVMSHLFPESGFRPMDLATALESMPHGTMKGLPTMSSDDSVDVQYLQRAMNLVSADGIYPCVAGWRGQPKGLHETPKQRLVWMFDHAETILGLSILYPVLNRLRVLPGFAAWSSDLVVDEQVTRLLVSARNARATIVSADFSNFDASVPYELIDCAFELLRFWFTDETKPRLDILQEVFATVPLLTPDGLFKDRKGGVPSGSALTNLIDTLVNLIAGYYVAVRLGVKLTDFEVLGDDSVFVFQPFPGVKELSQAFMELGLDSNPEKQFVSQTACHFLQRWHSLEYQLTGVHRAHRARLRLLAHERVRPYRGRYLYQGC